jgi:hypothetical protein
VPNDTKTRTYLAIIAALVVIVMSMGYKFIVAGRPKRGMTGAWRWPQRLPSGH